MRDTAPVSDVVTGEAVALQLRLAKLPSRLLAGALDLLIQLVALFGLLVLTGTLLSGAAAGAVTVVVIVLVFVGYPVAFETLTRGRTPGKMAVGLRAVRTDGGPVGFRQALVRGLVGALVEKPGLLFLGITSWIGVVAMLVSRDARRLGDLAAGTVVLQERVAAGPRAQEVAVMPPPLAAWAATADLAALDDRLALSVRQYLQRYPQLDPAAREQLGQRLAAAVAAVVTPPPPPGAPAWAYLAAVLAERRDRTTRRLTDWQQVPGVRPLPFTAPAAHGPPVPEPPPSRSEPFAPPG